MLIPSKMQMPSRLAEGIVAIRDALVALRRIVIQRCVTRPTYVSARMYIAGAWSTIVFQRNELKWDCRALSSLPSRNPETRDKPLFVGAWGDGRER